MFRRIFSTLFFILILAGTGIYFYNQQPCLNPIGFKIGIIDNRFGLSQAEFKQISIQAEEIWNKDAGKPLFKYDPKGALTVNLIYDSRQANADKNAGIISTINETTQSADAVRTQFLALELNYKQSLADYNALLAERQDFNAIESKRLEVNALAEQINALVKKYNYLVNIANTNINTVNQSAGKEFEEGEYVYDQNGKRINIYEFKTRSELIRVLAHEFGHALNMDHNKNPKSIMYYLNQSSNEIPTAEDTQALKAVCRMK
jgi:hypothetical protein